MKGIRDRLSRWGRTLETIWMDYFWIRPDHLWALKVSLSVALMSVPCLIMGEPFWATTLSLGAVGGALAESDDHPRGRRRTLLITLLSFVVMSLMVELLYPYALLFGCAITLAAFGLILVGGLSYRYEGITFAALLVGIYAMLGVGVKPWYYQPILLPLGAMIYGSVSLALLYVRPFRLLKEQLSRTYDYLSEYLYLKASLFPSNATEQSSIRTALAQKNVAIGSGIEKSKQVLYACIAAIGDGPSAGLRLYHHRWIVLQQLHERALSSHQKYDELSMSTQDTLLIEGFGQLIREIAAALHHYAQCILSDTPFAIPTSLRWTAAALRRQLERAEQEEEYATLQLLFTNLSRLVSGLATADSPSVHRIPTPSEVRPAPLRERIRALLRSSHPRFRHALRIVVCFAVGFALMELFSFEKGVWIILTSLFVCQQSYTATRRRLFQRILGTILGVALGAIFSALLPTQTGQVVLLIGSLYAFFYWVRRRYSIAVIFVTIFVIAAFNLQSGSGMALMGARMLCTLIGSFVAFMAVRFIRPDWQYKQLPGLVTEALQADRGYLSQIRALETRGTAYYHSRRAAHRADNALTTAWSGMHVEPRSKRRLQHTAYRITYLHHSLLSYISALGAHFYGKAMDKETLQTCLYIDSVLHDTEELLSMVDAPEPHDQQPDSEHPTPEYTEPPLHSTTTQSTAPEQLTTPHTSTTRLLHATVGTAEELRSIVATLRVAYTAAQSGRDSLGR